MYESLIPVNSLLRIFRISRGMCDICCPFLDSLPLHRPQPLPLLLCWISFSLPLLFMAWQFLKMASTAPFCTAGDVTTSCSTTSDCQVSLAHLLERSATGKNKIYQNPHFKWLFWILQRHLFAKCLLKLKCECLGKSGKKERISQGC